MKIRHPRPWIGLPIFFLAMFAAESFVPMSLGVLGAACLAGGMASVLSVWAAKHRPVVNLHLTIQAVTGLVWLMILAMGRELARDPGAQAGPKLIYPWLACTTPALLLALAPPKRALQYFYGVLYAAIPFVLLLALLQSPPPAWRAGPSAGARWAVERDDWLVRSRFKLAGAAALSLVAALLLLRISDIRVDESEPEKAPSPSAPGGPLRPTPAVARVAETPVAPEGSATLRPLLVVNCQGDSDRIRSVAGGRLLHVTDLEGSYSHLRSTETGERIWEAQPGEHFSGAAGERIFVTAAGSLSVRQWSTGEEIERLDGCSALGTTPAEDRLFVLDRERKLGALDPGTLQTLWKAEEPWPTQAPLSAWFSQCGKFMLAQVSGPEVELWSVPTRSRVVRQRVGAWDVTRIRPHPREPIFALSTMSRTVCCLDARRPDQPEAFSLASESRGLGWSDDGRWLLVVNSGDAELLWAIDYPNKKPCSPIRLPSDPWGLAVWGNTRLAIAHSDEIHICELEIISGKT